MDDLLNDPDFPHRPDHRDFWRLSEIILEMDGRFNEGDPESFERYVVDTMGIDIDSLAYMAMQRAMRLKERTNASLTAIYLEAFLVGRVFEQRYPATQSGPGDHG